MKRLLLLVMLFLSITLTAQERREYVEVDFNQVLVKVYDNNDVLTQTGRLVKVNDKWVNNGTWKQYHKGLLILKVTFKAGRKIVTKAYLEDRIVTIQHDAFKQDRNLIASRE